MAAGVGAAKHGSTKGCRNTVRKTAPVSARTQCAHTHTHTVQKERSRLRSLALSCHTLDVFCRSYRRALTAAENGAHSGSAWGHCVVQNTQTSVQGPHIHGVATDTVSRCSNFAGVNVSVCPRVT